MKITQLKNGRQERPYANHIYLWEIETDKPAEEVLDYCQKHLEKAAREEGEYMKLYRDDSLTFHEHMMVICEGYYTLTKTEKGYVYKVEREYID